MKANDPKNRVGADSSVDEPENASGNEPDATKKAGKPDKRPEEKSNSGTPDKADKLIPKKKPDKADKKDTKLMQRLGLPLALVIFAAAWFIPIPGMDELTRRSLGLMFFTVTLWITRPVFPALAAMLFMVLAWGLNLASFEDAFSGFTTSTTWFVWGALLIALAVKETRLGLRLARFLATRTPASTKGMLGSYFVLSFVMTYIIPSSTARVASLAPIGAAQVETLGLPLKSRAGKMLMTSLVTINAYFGAFLLSGGSTVVTAWGILNGLGIEISWVQWWFYMVVPGLVAMAVHYLVSLLIFRPETAQLPEGADVKKVAREELAKLGSMSLGEKKVSLIIGCTVLLWMTEPFHGLDTAFICCLCGITLCFPGIGVLNAKKAMRTISWDTVAFVAASLSIGTVTESTGVAELISHFLSFILNVGSSEYVFLLMMLVLGFVGRLVLRNGAANAAVLLAPTVALAQTLGYSPTLVGLFFTLSLGGIFMYQNTPALITYDYGTYEEPDFILSCMARYAGLVSFITFAYFIWWPLVI